MAYGIRDLKDIDIRRITISRTMFVLCDTPIVKEIHCLLDHCKEKANRYHDDHCTKTIVVAIMERSVW